jgi:transposase-like protein
MYKLKCPVCGDAHTVKNGKRKGVQTYLCNGCGYQFRNNHDIKHDALWRSYQEGKQTISELAAANEVSESTIKRRLREIGKVWAQPQLSGSGYVHLDATYWGHNWGVLLALDDRSGMPLYIAFVANERAQDYVDAVHSIEKRGYTIDGIVIDGKRSLFSEFSSYKIQMCHYHMIQITRRYLSQHPRLIAARELKAMVDNIANEDGAEFENRFRSWKAKWKTVLNRRSTLKSGKTQFTHKRLRSAMNSVNFYLPYLFTYQLPECDGMPNTNNKIEGTFTDLKKNLNNHSGMSKENRKRFISGFFLALKSKLEQGDK